MKLLHGPVVRGSPKLPWLPWDGGEGSRKAQKAFPVIKVAPSEEKAVNWNSLDG